MYCHYSAGGAYLGWGRWVKVGIDVDREGRRCTFNILRKGNIDARCIEPGEGSKHKKKVQYLPSVARNPISTDRFPYMIVIENSASRDIAPQHRISRQFYSHSRDLCPVIIVGSTTPEQNPTHIPEICFRADKTTGYKYKVKKVVSRRF